MSRLPSEKEKEIAVEAVRNLTNSWASVGNLDRNAAGMKALATFCHTIMNSGEFVYVD